MTICAVVVSYHPDAEIIENITALLEQVDEVVVVDNGSGSDTKKLFGKLNDFSNVVVIYNRENLGIAAALNVGVRHAKTAKHQWVWTFDQDSTVTPGMLLPMLQAYEAYPQKEKVASLSPRYQDKTTGSITGSRLKFPQRNILPYAESLVVITSGNLVNLDVFDEVGYFNEALFIDQVDNEFCLRCVTHGYVILEVNDAILEHCVGSPTQHNLLWKRPIATNHSVLRRYYIARNSLYVYRKFLFTYPMWVARDAYTLMMGIIILILFESDRRKKLVAICRGVFHGLLGKLGKFSG